MKVIEKFNTNDKSNIKQIIAVMSGKGGVGKSTVTSLIATALKEQGKSVGILDADITGPSIPRLFGINKKRASGTEHEINPVPTLSGINVMSVNLLLNKEEDAVIWRGPILANMVKQFYTEVSWGDLDYLLIDLPPGTGDVSLTTMQSIPVDGMIIVSTPQDLVELIVKKSLNMAKMMGTKVLGLVENMSYLECSDCHKKLEVFGKSRVEEIGKEFDIDVIDRIPIDPVMVELANEGKLELYGKMNFKFLEDLGNGVLSRLED